MLRHAPWLFLPITTLAACSPAGGDGDDGSSAPEPAVWEEEDDERNGSANHAEEVDEFEEILVIEGEMEDCGYDPDEQWPWTGDEDNFQVELPDDGFLEAVLDWESNSDLDMLIYFEPPGAMISPDEYLTSNSNDPPEQYTFYDELDRGDDVVFGVLCANGPGGDYTLTVTWED
jgi:hypothetical protein